MVGLISHVNINIIKEVNIHYQIHYIREDKTSKVKAIASKNKQTFRGK